MINIIACPLAVVFAVIAVMKSNKKFKVWGILSYVCCSLSIVFSVKDIISRAESNDVAGILDIYPTFCTIWLIVIGIITILNLIALIKAKK